MQRIFQLIGVFGAVLGLSTYASMGERRTEPARASGPTPVSQAISSPAPRSPASPFGSTSAAAPVSFRALVFSGTAEYRHESIPAGIDAIREMGRTNGFFVEATEEAAVFASDSLAGYDVVVFLNTSGDVLDDAQQAGLESYVRAGGGFAGIHGAAATEYAWSWYGSLVGGIFDNHPAPQSAVVEVLDRVHPSTRPLPVEWERFDEWYNFRSNPRGGVHILATLEESTYEGGEMGHDHPIVWAHEFDGGRSWYTGLGHSSEGYDDVLFREHLLGGLMWAAGVVPGDAAATITSSFEKVVLMDAVTDPVEMAIDSEGRVFVGERSGPVKMWDPASGRVEMVGYLPVRMTIEDGLLGLTLDPDFEENGWIYIYYAPEDGGPQRLARWTFDGSRLAPETERILLEIPTQQNECCHSGGSLTFGPEGNLFLSTGDNSNPYPLGGSAMDERPGFEDGDAQRTSANTNDLRGKIIRIRPLPDGSYEIPDGNLFEGDSLHRPEIYTMGHRNPYRISVDAETGWLYWGDVGIGNAPSEARGPWGWEEFNQARAPGFYGWPYFAGPNDAYRDYDRATETSGAYFDPDAPVNESPNNTGARELPPAEPAMIWYTYGTSEDFPELGSGGMSAMGGPVYRYDEEVVSPEGLPAYYDGSFFIYEWMRNWVQEVKFDEEGQVLEINPFLPGIDFARPGDMEVGPDGRLYVIEWGESFWGSNTDAQVVRLDYHGATGSLDAVASSGPRDTSAVPDDAGPPFVADDASGPALEPPDAAGASLTWPPHGGIFEFDVPIPFEVQAEEEAVAVYPFSGHDTHEHPLAQVQGKAGEVVISREFTHVPDLHYVDRYAVLETRTPRGQAHRIVLRPRIVEAEHAADRRLAERQTFGKHPAEPDFADAALTVMSVDAGGFLGYAPLNLTGIDTLVVRVKPMPGAVLEVRRDAPDGVLLGETVADTLSGRPAGEGGVLHAELLPGLPEGVQDAYRGWRDVRLPVSGAGATEKLYLVVRDASVEGLAVRIDRLEFHGPGVAKRPE